MTIKTSRIIQAAALALIAGAAVTEADAQGGPQYPPTDNYWPSHWWWYDNTYRPYYQFQYRQQPNTGYWQGYAGPPSINRDQGTYAAPNGTIYQGGGYQSGMFQRPAPYGWW